MSTCILDFKWFYNFTYLIRMITFGQHYAITLAAQHHKTKQPHNEEHNQQAQHNTSPGGVNVLLGG